MNTSVRMTERRSRPRREFIWPDHISAVTFKHVYDWTPENLETSYYLLTFIFKQTANVKHKKKVSGVIKDVTFMKLR